MDEFDEMEEDELLRGMVLRGIKTPRTSSEFMELRDWAPLSPHADRLMFAKLGGLATAVMRKDQREEARLEIDGGMAQARRRSDVVVFGSGRKSGFGPSLTTCTRLQSRSR